MVTQAQVYTQGKLSALARLLYGLGNAGGSFVWSFATSFLLIYYTDSVMLSAGLVGTIALASKLMDGVVSAVVGVAIERTQTRWGKARPWLMLSALPFAASLVLACNVPGGLSPAGRELFVALTYMLLMGVTYTVFNLGYLAMLPRLSFSPAERDKISSTSQIAGFVSGLVVSVATTPLLGSLGGYAEQRAWTVVSAIYAAVALVFIGLCGVCSKERVPASDELRPAAERVPLSVAVRAMAGSKYIYLAVGMNVLASLAMGLKMGVGVYYARDVLGSANYYIAIACTYAVSYIVGIALSPVLFGKLGKRRTILCGCALALVGGVTALTFPYRVAAIVFSTVVSSMGNAPLTTARFTFASQIVDYMDSRVGLRMEGIVSSVTSYGTKVGSGLGFACIGWGLSIGGYVAGAAVQSPGTIYMQIALLTGIPLLATLINTAMISFWDIDRQPAG